MVAGPSFKTLVECEGMRAFLQQFHHRRVGIPAAGSIHDVIFREVNIHDIAEFLTAKWRESDMAARDPKRQGTCQILVTPGAEDTRVSFSGRRVSLYDALVLVAQAGNLELSTAEGRVVLKPKQPKKAAEQKSAK